MLLYLAWFVIYDLWLNKNSSIDSLVIANMVFLVKELLELLGYSVTTRAHSLTIESTGGIIIGGPCNAIPLFALFTGFLIAFPGPVIKKLIFIPIGLLSIHILNLVRVTILAMIQYHAPQYLEFSHKYTFTIIIYGFIFLLWMLWVTRYSTARSSKVKIDESN